jgi:protease-4
MMKSFLLSCTIVVTSVAGQAQEAKKDPTEKATVAAISLKGSLPESVGQMGLFGDSGLSLSTVIDRLDRAAADDKVSAVVLKIRNPAVGRGKIAELRAAIQRVRDADKRVVAELRGATTSDYLLACACDEIAMPESGVLLMPGVRAEITFFRGLFDKLGIEADMMQVGDFKGAAEPYTRKEMSPEFRKQYEGLVDDIYDQLVTTIATSRNLDAAKVKELIDVGLFTPAAAKEAGLIDAVSYEDGWQDNLKKKLEVDQLELVKNYGKKKRDNDFSGMLGMMKLFEMMMGVEPSQRASGKKKVAVVYATGMILPGESMSSLFGGEVLGGDTIARTIREANDDKTVAAIVLRVDSPGGSALASDLIWRAVRSCDKPIVASMGDVAASGGYYISMGCDEIYAEPGTLTGSIGVVGGKIALGGLYDKIGLSTDVISRGNNSGLLSGDQPFTDSERAVTSDMMKEIYRQFVSKAAEGREMEMAEIQPLAGGRVWTGRQAKENGLVDQLGTLLDSIAAAKQKAGLGEDEKVELLILPRPKSIFDQLLDPGFGVRADLGGQLDAVAPELSQHLRTIERMRQLFREPGVVVMPYHLNIR